MSGSTARDRDHRSAVWASATYHAADGTGDPLRRLNSVGGGDELSGVGSAGECDQSQGHSNHESADAGSGDSRGVAVSATVGARATGSSVAGFAEAGYGN